jgi:hypothetical protein
MGGGMGKGKGDGGRNEEEWGREERRMARQSA